jgi:co-chaperonin GroES (HSP10)
MATAPAIDIPSLPFIPVGHFVMVKMPKVETKTAGGIIIPEDTRKKDERAAMNGQLMAFGPSCKGFMATSLGKTVYFGRYAGMLVEDGGEEYRLIDEDEIRAIA